MKMSSIVLLSASTPSAHVIARPGVRCLYCERADYRQATVDEEGTERGRWRRWCLRELSHAEGEILRVKAAVGRLLVVVLWTV